MTSPDARRLPAVPVHGAAAVRAADLSAQQHHGMPGYALMTAAAAAALADLREAWPAARQLVVACGSGNNAGDGYVLARLAGAGGFAVRCVAIAPPAALGGDAARAFADWRSAGGETLAAPALEEALASADVAVDALFGTGLARPVEGDCAAAVAALNAASCPVLALDLPSGLHADTGAVQGMAVSATFTSTFVGWKPGLFLGAGPAHSGRVRLHDLGVPPAAFATSVPVLQALPGDALRGLPARRRDAHKGQSGHVVVVGGDHGMPGAVRLAAEAALRSGAGKVTVLTRGTHAEALVGACPELMAMDLDAEPAVERLAQADAIVCGPGLGRSDWGRAALSRVLAAAADDHCALVLDADALTLLPSLAADRPAKGALPQRCVLTPHPGEAATLLGTSGAAVQADRLAAVRALCARWPATVVLKGAATLVDGSGGGAPYVCTAGNPGMATAGMGDVLAGVLGALLAQDACDPRWQFAPGEHLALVAAGVLAHALAGDRAAEGGERGLKASDLFAPLRTVLNAASR
jgi:ADP-dependent NAD(P)H-hydrate dehydratase / NAD(P)H-hydrate epimerase